MNHPNNPDLAFYTKTMKNNYILRGEGDGRVSKMRDCESRTVKRGMEEGQPTPKEAINRVHYYYINAKGI